MRQPDIDEIVAFLDKNDPGQLAALASENPQYSKILKVGHKAGPGSADELAVRRVVAQRGLKRAAHLCEQQITVTRSRLRSASTAQLVGQLAAAIGSASVFTTLALSFPKMSSYVAASISLAGALFGLIAQHLRLALGGGNLLEVYKTLIECRADAAQLSDTLDVTAATDSTIPDLVQKTNALCYRINLVVPLA